MIRPVESELPPYVPPGRPVPRFLAAIGGVTAVLLGLVVVGPLRADVSATIPEWTVTGERAVAVISISNHGRLPVEVTGVDGPMLTSPAPLLDDSGAAAARLAPGDPLGEVQIQPGETVSVTAVLEPDCEAFFGRTTHPFDLEVEVALGLRRTVHVDAPVGDWGGNAVADAACASVWPGG